MKKEMIKPSSQDWMRVDALIANHEVLNALILYRELTGSSLPEAKFDIGERVRRHFPERWPEYGVIDDDD